MVKRRSARSVALALAVSAVAIGGSGCAVGNSYWVGAQQCVLHVGPMEPSPNGPPDRINYLVGDLIYEACWTAEY